MQRSKKVETLLNYLNECKEIGYNVTASSLSKKYGFTVKEVQTYMDRVLLDIK